MAAPYTGGCLCGTARYRVLAEPLTVYACHCSDCQRRTGSAFALSMVVRAVDVELTDGKLETYLVHLPDGRIKRGKLCPACSTRLWGEPVKSPAIAVVQPGTLDNATGLAPVAHQFTRSAQPWFVFPADVPQYVTQPADAGVYRELWRNRGA